ncbi:MAG TPA: N-acetylmuramoyl-L-alanine amidase [Myxococcota bacterium]|nr:N-acetylmuramoyl-L-alanine amidase [Myxococcota bacterium]
MACTPRPCLTALRLALGLALLLGGLAARADEARAAPPEVSRDGAVVWPRVGQAALLDGPACPGEPRARGELVPGLVPDDLRLELRERFPELRPDARGGAADGRVEVPTAERLVVVLDPGHGGKEAGAKGVSGGREKELVLRLARMLQAELERLPGVEVVLTRVEDEHVPLWDRVTLAEQAGADLFVSVHVNAFVRSSLTGVETFFHAVEASNAEARRVAEAENAADRRERPGQADPVLSILADMQKAETLRDSSRLAHLVQEELVQALGFRNLGVQQADFVVLRSPRVPAVLLELGFVTNRKEERALRSPKVQQAMAQAVGRAVTRYRELLVRKRSLAGPAGDGAGAAP